MISSTSTTSSFKNGHIHKKKYRHLFMAFSVVPNFNNPPVNNSENSNNIVYVDPIKINDIKIQTLNLQL